MTLTPDRSRDQRSARRKRMSRRSRAAGGRVPNGSRQRKLDRRRSSGDVPDAGAGPDAWWIPAECSDWDESSAHRQNDLIERQRDVLGGLGPAPGNGEVGLGFASSISDRTMHDRVSGPPAEPRDPFPDEAGASDLEHVGADDDADSDSSPQGVSTDSRSQHVSTAADARAGSADNSSDAAAQGHSHPEVGEEDQVEVTADNAQETVSPVHPLLNDEAWADLSSLAPEMTGSIEGLRTLVDELECFARPMGPDEAIAMLDGIETINRLAEALSVVTLSVFQRVGAPRDYGAKTTKDLVRDRCGVSSREAARRVDLADNLGKRVTTSGESLEPVNPAIAEGLRSGRLSTVQAGLITRFIGELPRSVTEAQRLEAESILVDKAPAVHVKDIRILFDEILKWLDPDGELPKDDTPREDFAVHLRARKDGTWDLRGRLDAVVGGIMHGLLTSRMQSESESGTDSCSDGTQSVDDEEPGTSVQPAGDDAGLSTDDEARHGGEVGSSGDPSADDAAAGSGDPAGNGDLRSNSDPSADDAADDVVQLFSEVLCGDRYDAVDPTPQQLPVASAQSSRAADVPAGYGMRDDGIPVPMVGAQPSVRNRIYERFATIIGRIEMDRVGAGAPFALVVTAKAEDIAQGRGRATTGAAESFPIDTAVREGLNKTVFFHLMSEKGRTVSVETENRYANKSQLAILTARDKGCTFPGCETPPGWCEAHHIVPFSEGGKTNINNLTLACSYHHHLIDRTDWETITLFDGRAAWVPPATIDPARRPILHTRFIADDIADTLFG
ncbi:HNH endonuclease signature motif containing protein [Brevibacterium sp. 2SA]|uniref:HNH endonuclease signature motif containing protein n=1 Tax=Brevibacterium sp. 2SA TaxID=2502198 RepID=UPI00148547F5|nr:HNH endonuclease signature motif containing protein [Brevibacterium sp. 2SA]